ncbi:UTP--glucose-1-phosphate uridylyltransferase GalU [Ferroacidibacillus organovorans]|uniref:UTP--glucose-1-phosphate uridylyltransferase n=1 Tax=Ferroacidibacillus organovorans TaxID=1765683 RepID=A0A162TJ85_9BACL|nr:UTP--glucose-1-phosphate uridylyltransferase GalU [Ferroacidibacillus organovorans]KYP80861.1 UTP--glucose-1-phosphate uridylyltransferase [Ferroacidibacillus organovorans]OAG95406.1 UTP--glucose-1-phosphate uridylyltransferase [Ferroacidibacillus organovorans]OPG15757.1 UTP--glucose-1-phosphate uridylyltransferase [Ferroacidibacillus organovorans]
MKCVRKAVIPAAGLGTRFLPATKAQPKEMLPLVDKPAIQYIVEEAVAAGIEDILIVTGKSKRAIEDHFDRSLELEAHLAEHEKRVVLEEVKRISDLANIHYIRQPEPRGLGHAVSMARSFVGEEPFAIMLGDDIIHSTTPGLAQLLSVFERTGTSVVGVQEVPHERVSSYGIIAGLSTDGVQYTLSDVIEKPSPDESPSNLAIVGRYVVNASIFSILQTLPPGKQGEIQLTDALKQQMLREGMHACVIDGMRFDIGDKLGFLQATIGLALTRIDMRDELIRYMSGVIEQERMRSR